MAKKKPTRYIDLETDVKTELVQTLQEPIQDTSTVPSEQEPHRKAYAKIKCSCGNVENVSEQIIEDGLSWMMVIGNDHYLTLHCNKCNAELTLFLEEILDRDELPQEGNKE
jgi:predicted nucleic-acid-binding Zn-ribbon protein